MKLVATAAPIIKALGNWKYTITVFVIGLASLVALGSVLMVPGSNGNGPPVTISQVTAVPTPTTTLTCYNGLIVEWPSDDAWRQCVAPIPGPLVPCGKDSAIYGHSEPCALPTCPPGYAQGMFCAEGKEDEPARPASTIPPPPAPYVPPGCDPSPIGVDPVSGFPIPPPCMGFTDVDTLCADGWVSHNIGPGTCSWHGGIAR